MRIIEPNRPRRKRHAIRAHRVLFVVTLLVTGFLFGIGLHTRNHGGRLNTQPKGSVVTGNATATPITQKAAVKTTLKHFTAAEFEKLYNAFAYPNTDEIIDQPSITGNPTADQRIRDMALSRGYRLRSIPKSPMPELDTFTFQQLAMNDFKRLKQAASEAGMGLGIAAAFRSPEDQREIFLSRMQAAGVTADEIATGQADEAVRSLLAVTAIPGYSRHHTGYTLDLECGGWEVFAASPCFSWLSENNYEHAKRFGWIPSYPDGITTEGPEPEPWEYVWVGTDVLYE